MPIYEYTCTECSEDFELLIRGDAEPQCPACGAKDPTKRFSLPRVHSEGRKARSLAAAKKRDQKLGSERVHAQREYELNHDDH